MRQPVPFGKYLMLERINVGGMAEIFLARARSMQDFKRILAIKKILPTMAEDEEFIAMFIDEARIAAELSHTGIVQIYELGKFEDDYYISMEFVHGKDLRFVQERMQKRGEHMPLDLTAYVGSRLLDALDYAHSKRDPSGRPLGIIHRDISPQNVILSFDGQVKICDFGIAKAANRSQKTQAGVLKGKFGYMSPEQVRGMPLDGRSDIFTVGTLLYEMATMERLFMGESDFSTLEKVRNADVVPPSTYNRDVPEPIEDIILRALAKDVEDRYQSAGEMSDALQAYLIQERLPSARDLSAFMRETFPSEYEAEMQRLDEYQNLSEDELLGMVKPGEGRGKLEEVEAEMDEKTMIFASSTGVKKEPPPPLPPPRKKKAEAAKAPLESSPQEPWLLEKTRARELGDQKTQIFDEEAVVEAVEGEAAQGLAAEPLVMPPPPLQDTPPDGTVLPPVAVPARKGLSALLSVLLVFALGWAGVATWLWVEGQEPQSSSARLEIRSRPDSGLLVMLDGNRVSDKTPYLLPDLPPGEHHLKILRKGYGTYERRFSAKANSEVLLDATMIPKGLVANAPKEDLKPKEEPRPKEEPKPKEEPRPREEPRPKEPKVGGDKKVVKARPAELLVESVPLGASVFYNGRIVGKTPYRFREIKPGKAHLRLTHSGYKPGSKTISLKAGDSRRVNIRLAKREVVKPKPAVKEYGYLLANTRPWSKVFVDGKYTGRETPIAPDRKLKLSAGKHQVTFVTPDGRRFSFDIVIKANETKKLIKKLD